VAKVRFEPFEQSGLAMEVMLDPGDGAARRDQGSCNNDTFIDPRPREQLKATREKEAREHHTPARPRCIRGEMVPRGVR